MAKSVKHQSDVCLSVRLSFPQQQERRSGSAGPRPTYVLAILSEGIMLRCRQRNKTI